MEYKAIIKVTTLSKQTYANCESVVPSIEKKGELLKEPLPSILCFTNHQRRVVP